MAERVLLVHGWAVSETTTYQALHLKLAAHGFDLKEIYLGRYVSLDDEVEITDIARAMHAEMIRHLGPAPWTQPFHIITHSTGALVVKSWIVRHYVENFSRSKPLRNVLFLAGPHFGSRLAHHGRSMLAHAAYLGPTGKNILKSLELGSDHSWEYNGLWLDPAHWKQKGIRPFNLIGDRVERDIFKSKIFPAGYEKGSDMVVRAAAGNLNHICYELNALSGKLRKTGEIKGVPFAALADYVHSGAKHGIMNSITTKADPAQARYRNLRLILRCLRVGNAAQYARTRLELANETRATRKVRPAFAMLDLRFRDETHAPIDDYSFALGYVDHGREKPSKTVVHTHRNRDGGNRFTLFLNYKELDPQATYFMDFNSESGTELFSYVPDPLRVNLEGRSLAEMIIPDQTTRIDIILGRKPSERLFVFHPGDDPDLHVKWNRRGVITKRGLKIK